ncbi:MAG: VWA domain-containing protein [Defluviitaleaceae bacterium]|nr:VWA domain-containing protein [Defluviitaleaceae bacterium]
MKIKKYIIFTILLVAILALSACGGNDSWETSTADEAPSVTQQVPVPQPLFEIENSISFDFYDEAEEDMQFNPFSGESYLEINENRWISTAIEPTVSFTLQIDTASYRNITRFINNGQRPPTDAVRIAEMINYFNYDIVLPPNDTPFSIYTELGVSPFNPDNHLAFVRVRARDIDRSDLPGSNLTFLIDTSGSMAPHDRLPLLQQSFALLVENLDERDTVSVVTYAGCARVLLDSVPGNEHEYIMDAINSLQARGSTAGGPGIVTAYELATQNFDPEKNNRIILATDGDFNVGVSSIREIEDLMNEHRQRGIHMTILGFGMGNLRDDTMETIARNGNGHYHYVDTLEAAHKIFVEELISNLFVIAEDTRAQVAFNPDWVESYRLIGYENRQIDNRDFDDDERNAGEIGVGSDIVFMFEISLRDGAVTTPDAELFEVRIRYHEPGDTTSQLIVLPIRPDRITNNNSSDFTFAASVAAFGHILRDSEWGGNVDTATVLSMARDSLGLDEFGHRRAFIELVEQFARLQ